MKAYRVETMRITMRCATAIVVECEIDDKRKTRDYFVSVEYAQEYAEQNETLRFDDSLSALDYVTSFLRVREYRALDAARH